MNEEGECVSRAITYRQGRGRRKGTRMEEGMHTRKKRPLVCFPYSPAWRRSQVGASSSWAAGKQHSIEGNSQPVGERPGQLVTLSRPQQPRRKRASERRKGHFF